MAITMWACMYDADIGTKLRCVRTKAGDRIICFAVKEAGWKGSVEANDVDSLKERKKS